jgi:hypothetical protein
VDAGVSIDVIVSPSIRSGKVPEVRFPLRGRDGGGLVDESKEALLLGRIVAMVELEALQGGSELFDFILGPACLGAARNRGKGVRYDQKQKPNSFHVLTKAVYSFL